jgi:hypothetical protein
MNDETNTPETDAPEADTNAGETEVNDAGDATETVAEEPKKKGRGKATGPTIGSVATDAILAGATNQEALDAVQLAFPEGKTSLSSINWYRNKLRKDGADVKTARALSADAKALEPEAATGGGLPDEATEAPAETDALDG